MAQSGLGSVIQIAELRLTGLRTKLNANEGTK